MDDDVMYDEDGKHVCVVEGNVTIMLQVGVPFACASAEATADENS